VAAIAAHLPEGMTPIDKTCFSSAAAPAFCQALDADGRRQVVLAGIESHVCILQTALGLAEQGQEVFVAEDAVGARRAAHHRNAMERLRRDGIVVTNAESVIFEWLRDARHAQFKAVSALLKRQG